MLVGSIVPVMLWMQYTLSHEAAKGWAIGLVAVTAIGLFTLLTYRRRAKSAETAQTIS